MRLDPECIRDILFAIENRAEFCNSIYLPFFEKQEDLPQLHVYDQDKVLYHVRQCDLSGLLFGATWEMEGVLIIDLSPAGHAFLADIRADTNWSKVKSTAAKVGSYSLNTLTTIASSVISTVISDVLRGSP